MKNKLFDILYIILLALAAFGLVLMVFCTMFYIIIVELMLVSLL